VEELSIAFKNVALVKENESPENPGGLEKKSSINA